MYNLFILRWTSEILGACFSVIVDGLLFAPIVLRNNPNSAPLWWWQFFLKRNNYHYDERHPEFQSWAEALSNKPRRRVKRFQDCSGRDDYIDDAVLWTGVSVLMVSLAVVTAGFENETIY